MYSLNCDGCGPHGLIKLFSTANGPQLEDKRLIAIRSFATWAFAFSLFGDIVPVCVCVCWGWEMTALMNTHIREDIKDRILKRKRKKKHKMNKLHKPEIQNDLLTNTTRWMWVLVTEHARDLQLRQRWERRRYQEPYKASTERKVQSSQTSCMNNSILKGIHCYDY